MPTYRKQSLVGYGQYAPDPLRADATGLTPALRTPTVEAFRAQDKIAALSRRIVLSSGLRGDTAFRVPNTDPEDTVTQAYPDAETFYAVARGRIEVTPGCFYRMTGACVPSGPTQYQPSVGSHWFPNGTHGRLRLTVVWTDRSGATETTTREVLLPGSTLQYGAEDTSAAGMFRTLRTFAIEDIVPPFALTDVVELARFCRHVTADITLEVQGSPRVVDVTVHEIPIATAVASDQTVEQVSGYYATGTPDAPGVPLQRPTTTQAARMLAVARQQGLRLGPCLAQWSAYSEDGASPTATMVPRTTSNDGTTFEALLNASHTGTGPAAYNANLGGWSVSCGGHARRWANNNNLVLYDRYAVIPVIVRVRGRGVTAGTSTFRFQTALHSYVDVTLAVAGSASWTRGYGWLTVGLNPSQSVIGQAFINHVGASGSMSVEAFEVYFNASAAGA